MQDIPIPGQPLVYNVNIVSALRAGKGSRTGLYSGHGPGQFRMTGRAPLAYDVSAEASSVNVALHPTGNEGYFASQDILQEQHVSSIPQRKHSDVSSVMLTVSGRAGKPSRTGPFACWDWLIAKCSCLVGRSSSKDNQLMSTARSGGVKAPREFATFRAMAALAAATAATAVSDPTKAPHADEEQTKAIQLDRPARELLIWSILVGKLRMAELFWTMEKEPIAGALLASILLTSLGSKTDDFTDKEDYRSFAKIFQERAEGVLNECYREDEHRTQLIINHELMYYGRSSVIKLAAEGQSIKFMAHPCCQDFLTNTWSGNLSTKNSVFRYFLGIICGLTIPFLIPKVILAKPKIVPTTEEEETQNTTESTHVNNEDAVSVVMNGAPIRKMR
ncbi:hypothetical protein P879_04457 [Paragonimus westermani]|uniref:TRPM-like domain-containing protein n=1 Tax=Paragonimus westermani TaxID=34504 RepID=A0A8T0DRR5_9TREM|nr:hypothetical protein P879_04457 [Paragonimus westermani]